MNGEQTTIETVEVDDMDTLVKLLSRWHSQRVKRCEHLLQMPEGIEMQVGDEPPFRVEGNILKGLKAGINLALMEFGKLPFAFEMEPESPEEPAQANAATPT
jgi:hypothetical protein